MENIGKTLLGNPRNKEKENILGPRKTQAQTNAIAERLVQKLNSPEHIFFFLKTAWCVDEQRIEQILEYALAKAANPRAYFISAIKNERSYRAQANRKEAIPEIPKSN